MTNRLAAHSHLPPHQIDRVRLGTRLRAIRKTHTLTLQSLSARSGVALSTLSKIELGQISVSYEKLVAVAHALDVSVSDLFDERGGADQVASSSKPLVVRSVLATAPGYDGPTYDYTMLATDFPGKRMTPTYAKIVLRHSDPLPDFVRHVGQEFVMVLSGKLRIQFENGEAVELAKHESAYFDSSVGHLYLSTGRMEAQVIIVMTEPAPEMESTDNQHAHHGRPSKR